MEIETNQRNNVSVIAIKGRFDAQYVDSVRKKVREAIVTTPNLVVDLGEATFLDSAALAVLVQGMKHARQAKGDLRIANLQNPVKIIFELTRLDKAFSMFSTVAEAEASFNA